MAGDAWVKMSQPLINISISEPLKDLWWTNMPPYFQGYKGYNNIKLSFSVLKGQTKPAFVFLPRIRDPNDDKVTLTCKNLPFGLSYNKETNAIVLAPEATSDLLTHRFRVILTDEVGLVREYLVDIEVEEPQAQGTLNIPGYQINYSAYSKVFIEPFLEDVTKNGLLYIRFTEPMWIPENLS